MEYNECKILKQPNRYSYDQQKQVKQALEQSQLQPTSSVRQQVLRASTNKRFTTINCISRGVSTNEVYLLMGTCCTSPKIFTVLLPLLNLLLAKILAMWVSYLFNVVLTKCSIRYSSWTENMVPSCWLPYMLQPVQNPAMTRTKLDLMTLYVTRYTWLCKQSLITSPFCFFCHCPFD